MDIPGHGGMCFWWIGFSNRLTHPPNPSSYPCTPFRPRTACWLKWWGKTWVMGAPVLRVDVFIDGFWLKGTDWDGKTGEKKGREKIYLQQSIRQQQQFVSGVGARAYRQINHVPDCNQFRWARGWLAGGLTGCVSMFTFPKNGAPHREDKFGIKFVCE